ncbi:MAG: hypothetical protein ABI134_29890 [Byssovorax sp.]
MSLKAFVASVAIIIVSFRVVQLDSTWVAIQLIMVNVPILMLKFQEKDAKGRAIPATRRTPGVIGSGIPYSQAGGKFAVFFCFVVGPLLDLMHIQQWWPHVGISTTAQETMVLTSLCVSMGYLLVYIHRRWPDEPKEEREA